MKKIIPVFQKLQAIVNTYPTHQSDISYFGIDNGSFGQMRGKFHALQAKLQILPDDANQQLIEGTIGSLIADCIAGIDKASSLVWGI